MFRRLTLTLIVFFITLLVSTNVNAMEIGRTAMHTGEEEKHVIINDLIDAFFFEDARYREMVFNKTAQQPQKYEVQKGDNLYRIAINHQVELSDLMMWNNKSDSMIHPGEELIIKGGVKPNEAEIIPTTAPVVQEQSSRKEEQPSDSVQQTQIKEVNEEPEAASGELIVTATAYTAYCEGCSGTTAIGIDLRANPNQKVIAVDPNVIPLGTKVWVEGYGEAIAGDTGGAIKGNKIDVFIPSYDQAMQWGRKSVKLRILN